VIPLVWHTGQRGGWKEVLSRPGVNTRVQRGYSEYVISSSDFGIGQQTGTRLFKPYFREEAEQEMEVHNRRKPDRGLSCHSAYI
jgi:hypothetical protein